eukprot:TRINITY_DN105526_c0_g1_i1.p1 TRINITY_DN105526_c0_g1~~TRINITY_DN105526_c0_g1_i1.p1  ORF type:complete len:291 (-),score=36.16 TRINITY_DN105526_c0_g1_i1:215-1087(-)
MASIQLNAGAEQVDTVAEVSRLLKSVPIEAFSGAIGGPTVVGVLTPLRNASTLAAKNVEASYAGLYRKVFEQGLVKGWRGCGKPMIAGVPQFTACGPVYHLCNQATSSSTASVVAAATIESLFTFGSHRRNAQIQFNATRPELERIQYHPLQQLTGAGFVAHVTRNIFAMSGIRVLSPLFGHRLECLPGMSQLSDRGRLFTIDLVLSGLAASMSMPFNHIFSWSSCTPELDKLSYRERFNASIEFMLTTYKTQGLKLFARDLAVRVTYASLLFSGYNAIEREVYAISRQR